MTPRPVLLDCGATLTLAAITTVGFHEPAKLTGVPHPVALIFVLLSVLPTTVRRLWPRTVLAVVVLASAAVLALSVNPAPVLAAAYVMYLIPGRPC